MKKEEEDEKQKVEKCNVTQNKRIASLDSE